MLWIKEPSKQYLKEDKEPSKDYLKEDKVYKSTNKDYKDELDEVCLLKFWWSVKPHVLMGGWIGQPLSFFYVNYRKSSRSF